MTIEITELLKVFFGVVILLLGFVGWQFRRLVSSVDDLNMKMEVVLFRLPRLEKRVEILEKGE